MRTWFDLDDLRPPDAVCERHVELDVRPGSPAVVLSLF